MSTCSNCHDDVGYDNGQDYADGGFYCDYCIKNSPQLRERIERIRKRNEALGHTDSDMCGCSMCAAKFEN